jgi:hypothetical protein
LLGAVIDIVGKNTARRAAGEEDNLDATAPFGALAGSDACGAAAGAAGWQPAVVRMKVMTSRIERILIGDFMLQNSFDISRSDRSDFGWFSVVLQPRQISYARSPTSFL